MADSTPICRCRVLYLGSSVPRQSKEGLQGIQEPLRTLYPAEGAIGAKGIDSWLSVWSNGILLENVDENLKQITRFFPIESLHYCAAVRQVLIPERGNSNPEPKFLPLDSPFARMPRVQHPPIFAAILRRTTGIKVLECHVFICKREAAANALVRCCFHAYADNSYARQLEAGSIGNSTALGSVYGTLKKDAAYRSNGDLYADEILNESHKSQTLRNNDWRSRTGSITAQSSLEHLASKQKASGVTTDSPNSKNFYGSNVDINIDLEDGDASIYNGDENHKIWNGSQDHLNGVASESPYEMFTNNTSTLGRHTRARQMTVPINVPPPPIRDEARRSNEKNKKKPNKTLESQSLSGTLMRPKPIHSSYVVQSNLNSMAGRVAPLAPLNGARQYHTISCRSIPHGPLGPPITGHHPHHQYEATNMHAPPPHFMQSSQVHMGYPMHVPVLMPQRYATLQHPTTSKKKKKDKKKSIVPVGMPTVPPIYAYQQQAHLPAQHLPDPRALGMSNRKHAASVGNGLDDSGNSGTESPIGTGIYRRKGHLNERAFSYSIRQEHRSRSHGSLASIQFNPPDMKKEREIAQMVAGLELDDNEYNTGGHSASKPQLDTNGDLHNRNHYIYDNHRSDYRNVMADSLTNARIK